MRLTNALERHQANPDTFHLPDDVDRLERGWFAKIGLEFDLTEEKVDAERFWVEALHIGPTSIIGSVANHLLYADEHGYDYGDHITFERCHILATYKT